MTRSLDQADVDAVLEHTLGDAWAEASGPSKFVLRNQTRRRLEAAIALGWTPPARPGEDPVPVRLAFHLERLAAQIREHLDPDANEGVEIEDPQWADTHRHLVDTAAEAVAVLGESAVVEFLTPPAREEATDGR